MKDPAATLVPPVAHEIVPDFLEAVLRAPDWLSPSHWLFWIVEKLGGANLSEQMGEMVAGDWSVVAKASDALTHLGEFSTACAAGIRADLVPLDAGWDGRAASAAATYFGNLAGTLDPIQKAFDGMASELRATAYGIKSTCSAISGSVEALYDVIIALNVEAACAAIGAETVILPIICGGIGVATAAEGVRLVLDIGEGFGRAMLIADSIGGLIAGFLGTLDDLQTFQLPGPYVNQGIPPP